MRALACTVLITTHVAAADPPREVSKRAAIKAWVPGMAEAEARKRANELGCDDSSAGDALACVEGDAPAVGGWTLWFEHGRLERVDYMMSIHRDVLDPDVARAAMRAVDRRAAELSAAADASGGAKTRARIHSSVTAGHRVVWAATRARASALQLAVWQDQGKDSEYQLAFEIVAPHAAFTANGLFEHAD
jgi:hypothetical protein